MRVTVVQSSASRAIPRRSYNVPTDTIIEKIDLLVTQKSMYCKFRNINGNFIVTNIIMTKRESLKNVTLRNYKIAHAH